MALTLQIFWLNEEMQGLEELELEVKLEDCELKEHTFYDITFIHPVEEKYCAIGSGGDKYTCNESYASVKQKIRDQQVFKFN